MLFIGDLLSEIGYGIAFGITGMAAKADIALSSIGISTSSGRGCSGGTTTARASGQTPTNPPEFSDDSEETRNSEPKPKNEQKPKKQKPKNPEQDHDSSHNFDVSGGVEADMKNRPVVNGEYNIFDDATQPNPPQQRPTNPPQQRPVQQAPTTTPNGRIMHAIDMPKKDKPVTMPQDPPEVISDNNTSEILKGMRRLKADAVKIPINKTPIANVAKEVAVETATPKLESKFPDNQILFKNYPYLKDIEQIALDNGYQIRFAPYGKDRIRFIVCQVVDNNTGMDIGNKTFTIDLGNIIDSRAKIFIGVYQTYENMTAYHLFGIDKKLNSVFIRNLIVGGNSNIAGGKAMYTKDFVMANSVIDMSTIPNNLNKEDRKFVQDLLVRAAISDTFDKIITEDKLTRFRVVMFDRDSKSILIDSKGVPKHFGLPYVEHPRHTFLLYYDTNAGEDGKPQPKALVIDESQLHPSLI